MARRRVCPLIYVRSQGGDGNREMKSTDGNDLDAAAAYLCTVIYVSWHLRGLSNQFEGYKLFHNSSVCTHHTPSAVPRPSSCV